MKKIFTLLLVFTAMLSSTVFAQCNAEFTFTVNNNTGTVQFIPVNNSAVQHQWSFGDGTSGFEATPSHLYAPGAYNVVHVVTAYSPNDSNLVECIDSSVRWVTVTSAAPCNLNASFTFTRDSIQPNKVYFSNLSTGGNPNTVTYWNFGDGSVSYDNNPIHLFPSSGVYAVCLTIQRDERCAADTCGLVQVQVPACNLTVNYSFAADSSNRNLIHFINLSTPLSPGDSVLWNFGDGFYSNDVNASHTYADGGYYPVCLIIKKIDSAGGITCLREQCRLVTINPVCNIVPQFEFVRDTTTLPFPAEYRFYNTTTGLSNADSSFWDFGDNTPLVINPNNPITHIYPAPGVYTICLTVKKVQPGTTNVICERQICHTFIVDTPQVPCSLQAYFSYLADSSAYNKIYFTNHTQPLASTDSIRWTFGDGSSSIAADPIHTYNVAGTYTVCIRVEKPQAPGIPPCVSEYCKVVVIQPATVCNMNASFAFVRDSVHPNKVYFSNQSTGTTSNTVTRWNFGDGTTSFDNNPTHIYQASGAYRVCLIVRRDSLCASDTCIIVQVQVPTNPCNLVANFSATIDPVNTSRIHFTNLSIPLAATDSVVWNFGDGSVSHDVFNVSHTYTQGGVFDVCLSVRSINSNSTAPCVRQFCQRIIVDTPQVSCNLVAGFTFRRDSLPTTPISPYIFENTSTPLTTADSSFWDFGDGSPVVINPNNTVVHLYTSPGTYIVCLKVKKVVPGTINVICERQTCQTIVVANTSNPCDALQVNFSWHPDSANNRKVYFVNQSSPLTANTFANWSFGDGDSSMASSPDHIYAQPGTYTVCLTMRLGNVCVKDTCAVVVVQGASNPCNQLQVSFTWTADSSNNRKIYFINQSSPLTTNTYTQWSFGDGTNGTGLNPGHIYAQPGTYRVCLTMGILGTNCIKDTCQTIVILPGTVDSCTIQPNFTYITDSSNRRKVYFSNTTVTPASNGFAVWSFGDGTSGTGWNADHVYQQPGWYLVCLSITLNNTCTRTHCDSIFVPGNVIPPVNCDSFQLQFGYRRDGYMPNKLFFTATGNAPVYNQQWSFTKIGDSLPIIVNHNNPVFVFPDTGLYKVCVRAAFSTNCVKEYCNEVIIRNTSVPQRCFLQSYPNPAHNRVSFNVQLQQGGIITASVFSLRNGQVLQHTQQGITGNNQITMDISNLRPGFYAVRIMYAGKVCHTRFLKF